MLLLTSINIPAGMTTTTIVACYTVGSIVVVLFGTFACLYTYLRHRKLGPDSNEFFLTARRSTVSLLFSQTCR